MTRLQENVNDVSVSMNENINDSESSGFSLFKTKILEAIDTSRTKKKRADKELCRNQGFYL